MHATLKRAAILLAMPLCGTVSAFNAGGHMVVGLIAYDTMEPATRAEVIRILRQHPRIDEHFFANMPEEVRSASETDQDRWLFAYAGCWPDVVRSSKKVGEADRREYNRSTWHYVNFPTFLTNRDRDAMIDNLTVNLETEPSGDEYGWNVVQAYKNAQRIWSDPDAQDEDKAVAFCWIAHIAADSHQPLHSTALFTMGRFEEGDRGGNSITTTPGSNLHAVWDETIIGRLDPSKLGDYNRMRQRAVSIIEANREDAWQPTGSIDEWLQESLALAKKFTRRRFGSTSLSVNSPAPLGRSSCRPPT